MAITIENNGASLKITEDGATRFVLKNQIREVEVVRDTIIKLDIGQGALNNIFVDQASVTAPASTGVEDLRDQLMGFIQTTTNITGFATEVNQNKELETLKSLQNTINALNEKMFIDPILIDESNPNVIYNGYALPGAKVADPVWAIQKVTKVKGVLTYQWAAGNKTFDKVWNNRTALIYS
ncbi:MAG: hypothetical protein JST26_08260 [Bacteroidetes bacterium]|nr:hypothetical protein [Bacteroidota bacterium]